VLVLQTLPTKTRDNKSNLVHGQACKQYLPTLEWQFSVTTSSPVTICKTNNYQVHRCIITAKTVNINKQMKHSYLSHMHIVPVMDELLKAVNPFRQFIRLFIQLRTANEMHWQHFGSYLGRPTCLLHHLPASSIIQLLVIFVDVIHRIRTTSNCLVYTHIQLCHLQTANIQISSETTVSKRCHSLFKYILKCNLASFTFFWVFVLAVVDDVK